MLKMKKVKVFKYIKEKYILNQCVMTMVKARHFQ